MPRSSYDIACGNCGPLVIYVLQYNTGQRRLRCGLCFAVFVPLGAPLPDMRPYRTAGVDLRWMVQS